MQCEQDSCQLLELALLLLQVRRGAEECSWHPVLDLEAELRRQHPSMVSSIGITTAVQHFLGLKSQQSDC